MDDFDKLPELRVILGDDSDEDDATLLSYLSQAGDAILNRLYPYLDGEAHEDLAVPRKYENKQIRIAAFLLNKRGAEGETQHIENGTHRNYGNADIPEDMLRDIVPMVGIPR